MSLLLGFDTQHLRAFGNNWKRFFVFGVVLFILGLLAISAATFTTLLSVIFLGFLLLFGGVILAYDAFTFWHQKGSGFFLHLLFALLYIAAGLIFIFNPIAGSVSLTFFLGIFYIILGIFRLAFSPTLRAPNWGWGWLNGVITLLLGLMIIASWPSSSLFIIGLFVGIDLVFCGIAYMMSAMAAKKLSA